MVLVISDDIRNIHLKTAYLIVRASTSLLAEPAWAPRPRSTSPLRSPLWLGSSIKTWLPWPLLPKNGNVPNANKGKPATTLSEQDDSAEFWDTGTISSNLSVRSCGSGVRWPRHLPLGTNYFRETFGGSFFSSVWSNTCWKNESSLEKDIGKRDNVWKDFVDCLSVASLRTQNLPSSPSKNIS